MDVTLPPGPLGLDLETDVFSDAIVVASVRPGPARDAGVRKGDTLERINEHDSRELGFAAAMTLLRTEPERRLRFARKAPAVSFAANFAAGPLALELEPHPAGGVRVLSAPDPAQPGDRLVSVNGRSVRRMSLEAVVALLHDELGAERRVVQFERAGAAHGASPHASPDKAKPRPRASVVARSESSSGDVCEVQFSSGTLGLELETGWGGRGVVVKQLRAGGAAAAAGTINVHDTLVAVNGESTAGMRFADVMRKLQETALDDVRVLQFQAEARRRPTSMSSPSSPRPTTATVQFDEPGPLGLDLESGLFGAGVMVRAVQPGRQAARTGAVAAGDELVAIGDADVTQWTFAQVMDRLRETALDAHRQLTFVRGAGGGGGGTAAPPTPDRSAAVYELDFKETRGGLGIEFETGFVADSVVVKALLDGPAKASRMVRVGDTLVSVNGQPASAAQFAELMARLRQLSGEGAPISLAFCRGALPAPPDPDEPVAASPAVPHPPVQLSLAEVLADPRLAAAFSSFVAERDSPRELAKLLLLLSTAQFRDLVDVGCASTELARLAFRIIDRHLTQGSNLDVTGSVSRTAGNDLRALVADARAEGRPITRDLFASVEDVVGLDLRRAVQDFCRHVSFDLTHQVALSPAPALQSVLRSERALSALWLFLFAKGRHAGLSLWLAVTNESMGRDDICAAFLAPDAPLLVTAVAERLRTAICAGEDRLSEAADEVALDLRLNSYDDFLTSPFFAQLTRGGTPLQEVPLQRQLKVAGVAAYHRPGAAAAAATPDGADTDIGVAFELGPDGFQTRSLFGGEPPPRLEAFVVPAGADAVRRQTAFNFTMGHGPDTFYGACMHSAASADLVTGVCVLARQPKLRSLRRRLAAECGLPVSPDDDGGPEIDLDLLFSCLDLGNVVTLFTAVLLEQRIVLVSARYSVLTHVALALTSLARPLQWHHLLSPVLPRLLLDYLSCPTPFIFGIHATYANDSEVPGPGAGIVVVDLDANSVHAPPLPFLPPTQLTALTAELHTLVEPALARADDLDGFAARRGPLPVDDVRALFARVVGGLLDGFERCCHLLGAGDSGAVVFDEHAYLASRPEEARRFLAALFRTQGFAALCETFGQS